MEFWKVLLKYYLEGIDVLNQQRELVRVKFGKSCVVWLCLIGLLGQQGTEEPESFFFTRSANHQNKPNDKIHALTIAHLRVVHSICL